MSKAGGPSSGEPIGVARVDIVGNTAPLEASVEQAKKVAAEGAAQASAAASQAAAAPVKAAAESAKEAVKQVEQEAAKAASESGGFGAIGQSIKDWAKPLKTFQSAITSTVGIVSGLAATFSLVAAGVYAAVRAVQFLWRSVTDVGQAATEAANRIHDPLLKAIEEVKASGGLTVNADGLQKDVARINEIVPKIRELEARLQDLRETFDAGFAGSPVDIRWTERALAKLRKEEADARARITEATQKQRIEEDRARQESVDKNLDQIEELGRKWQEENDKRIAEIKASRDAARKAELEEELDYIEARDRMREDAEKREEARRQKRAEAFKRRIEDELEAERRKNEAIARMERDLQSTLMGIRNAASGSAQNELLYDLRSIRETLDIIRQQQNGSLQG